MRPRDRPVPGRPPTNSRSELDRRRGAVEKEVGDAISRELAVGSLAGAQTVLAVERAFADIAGTRHGIAVNSCTDGLELVLLALGLGPGDEVITVANSFVASVASIVCRSATPVLVDVGADESVDVDAVARAIGPRTRAVLVVHHRGLPARVDRLARLCDAAGVMLVEDCAQAAGATLLGRSVGSFGVAGCFSLHPHKIVGGFGDGGVVVTDDGILAGMLRRLRNHGLDEVGGQAAVFGRNSRLNVLQAAAVLAKLQHLPAWLARRRSIAAYYLQELGGCGLELPTTSPRRRHSFHSFAVRLDERDELLAWLLAHEVSASVPYPVPIHRQPAWTGGFPQVVLPVTERHATTTLTVPCHEWLSDQDVDHVVRTLVSWTRQRRRSRSRVASMDG